MSLFWRAARSTCVTGLAAGTFYFFIIGVVTFFGGVITGGVPTWLWLVLFVGVGAGLGLLLGLVCAVALAVVLPMVRPAPEADGHQRPGTRRVRVVGSLACGLPVLVITVVDFVTGSLSPLSQEFTTVIVIPTAVAATGGAAVAPSLLGLATDDGQPKRPEI